MKKLRHNIRLLGILTACLFIVLAGYFSYSVYFYGGRWFANANNSRLYDQKQQITAGDITDRKGTVLATTTDGSRVYPRNEDMRRAVSHVVGDSGGVVANGVETFMAGYLLGFNTGPIERVQQLFSNDAPKGDDVQLTIDADLCTYAANQLKRYEAGAVIVLNYVTGEVLCSTSYPDFDPRNVKATMDNPTDDGAFFNRVTQSQYPPGSTFKIITAAAALENIADVTSRQYYCSGNLRVDQTTITEASAQVHGSLSMKEAFARSCNTTFGTLSLELSYSRLSRTASAFGFGDNFLFRDMVVENSNYPITNQNQDDLAWSGIGQGRVQTTPLHMAMIAGAIANDGIMMEPRLMLSATSAHGSPRVLLGSRSYKRVCNQQTASILQEYMLSCVESGTGSRAKVSGYKIAGKTGSAEVSDDKSVNTHAWFVGYVDDIRHPIAIAVVVERGGSGGSVAAPIASRVLDKALQLGY